MLHRRILRLVALAVLNSVASLPGQSQLTDADRKGIQTVTDNFVKAVLAGDSVAGASAYTEDAMLLPPNQAIVEGRDAIRHYLAGFPKMVSFTAPLLEIEGRGDLAYTRGTYELTFMPAGAKTAVKDAGKFIEIRRKQPDGGWLIQRDFWNSDAPPPK